MKLVTSFIISLALVLSGTMAMAADKPSSDAEKKSVSVAEKKAADAISAAEASRKKAASVDGEWRDTGKIIKKAQAALKEGKIDSAIKLANFAERQGQYGYEQAMTQKALRMPSYLKY